MKKLLYTITSLMLCATMGFAQNMQQQIDAIQENIKQIRTVKYTIDYRTTVHSGSILDFEETTTDTKGKKNSVTYRMNLADIDPNKLETGIERDMMKLEVHTGHSRRLITEIKEGQVSRYLARFKFDVADNDQARLLSEALTKAAATAKQKEDSRYGYASLEEILVDLAKAVKKVEPVVSMQSISFVSDNPGKLSLVVQEDKRPSMKYEFNLKDLNVNDLDFEARGTDLSVKFVTNGKEKVIKVFENDLAKTFVASESIRATDVENGKHILRLLELATRVVNGASLSQSGSGTGVGLAAFNFKVSMRSGTDVPTPPFSNKPCWSSVSGSVSNDFEKQEYNEQAKATFGGGRGLVYLSGQRSSIRFNGGSEVIAMISTGGLDPSNIVDFKRFEVNQSKDRREYVTTKGNFIGTSVEVDKTSIPISFKDAGDGLYLIVPDSPLPPGEYVFCTDKFGYAFGVD